MNYRTKVNPRIVAFFVVVFFLGPELAPLLGPLLTTLVDLALNVMVGLVLVAFAFLVFGIITGGRTK